MTLVKPEAERLEPIPIEEIDSEGDHTVPLAAVGVPLLPAEDRPVEQRRRVLGWSLVWVAALIAGTAFVIYGFGPLFQAREQRRLINQYKQDISRSANESSGLGGVSTPTKAPNIGTPVAILEIGAIKLQQAVIEGGYAAQTRRGPGHIAGTAGLGQPGNSVVVGRAHAFGGSFGAIGRLRPGDQILVTTTQGQSVYRVTNVRHSSLGSVDGTYGPSRDNRLTLVTSGSTLPWNSTDATVVVATIEGLPFPPTLQNGRGSSGLGVHGDTDADASVVLAMFAFAVTISASIALYRRVHPATAYLLSIGPLMATAIIAGETLTRLLPGWT
ncbi:MAG: sortase [Actinomycetota bacterium]|nr:sortase [Actinomycetota bacterium]